MPELLNTVSEVHALLTFSIYLSLIIDLARVKSEAPIYAFQIYFRQWTWNHCKEIHKSVLNFRGEPCDWKTWTWACDELKANNWLAENLKLHVTSMSWHLSPEYSHVNGQRIPFLDDYYHVKNK